MMIDRAVSPFPNAVGQSAWLCTCRLWPCNKKGPLRALSCHSKLLHVSLNPIRFNDKNMQPFKVLQRPLRV
ncbi:hypothetical protein GFB56_08125 [Ensifer sp. T173]|uniref:Uncharacterized protein n=1 Tax=Ensifer canadensis TaxID=555315 RepID=A0AAW4FF68_9HYPH|nr:hypothetical protein [Ensifer canadensis]